MRGALQKEMFAISDLRRRVIRSVCPFFRGRGYSEASPISGACDAVYPSIFNIFWVFQKTEFFGGMKIL